MANGDIKIPITTSGNDQTTIVPSASFGRSVLNAADAAALRTLNGATTVGSSLLSLTNPSAISALRVNADNSVTAIAGTPSLLADFLQGTVTTTETVTNSTTLTDSTALQFSLAVGTWFVESMEYVGSSSFAAAGCVSNLTFTGTGTFTGTRLRGGAVAAEPVNGSMTWGGSSETMEGTVSNVGGSGLVMRRGILVVTVSGTLKVRFAQQTAVAAQTASLIKGSYLKATRSSY